MNRMTGDLFELTELAHHGQEDLFIAIVTIIGSLIIMFPIQWRLALVILIIIPIFLLVVIACRRNMVITSRNVKVKMAEINGEIESGLSGIRTSKAFANEDVDYAKFSIANERFKTAKCDNYRAFGKFNSSLEYFMCIMPVVIMAVGGWLIMRNRMDYVDLITFYLYIGHLHQPDQETVEFHGNVHERVRRSEPFHRPDAQQAGGQGGRASGGAAGCSGPHRYGKCRLYVR